MKIPTENKQLMGVYKNIPKLNKVQFDLFKRLTIRHAKHYLLDTEIKSRSFGKIYFSQKGFEHNLSMRGTVAKTKALTVISEMLRCAIVTEIKPDKKHYDRFVLTFVCSVIADGKIWKASMYVKQDVDLNFFFYHLDLNYP